MDLQPLRADDARLRPPDWHAPKSDALPMRIARILAVANVVFAIRYISWLVAPGRSSNAWLYALLLGAEAFNMAQGLGFWWTLWSVKPERKHVPRTDHPAVDVLIPTFNEDVDVVEPTVMRAMQLRGAEARVALLDDGGRADMQAVAARHGAEYVARPDHDGAKAGNINWQLSRTDAPFVAVLDCDHVPLPEFLEVSLASFDSPDVAFVQTPQYYANGHDGGLAEASWSQQALFFGTIAPGRDARGAMFCCGTNVVFRREALESAGGFPTESLTEDFELSVRLHSDGWKSRYIPTVLASGLGPEDMGSYVSQQLRWARGCLSALPKILVARLRPSVRLQYLLAAAYWLTGWTLLVYMLFPLVRIVTGQQPVEVASAEQFLVYWLPYFAASMATVALTARGRYTYSAFALMASIFWVHALASVLTLFRRKGAFKVTPKQGTQEREIKPVLPTLTAAGLLAGVSLYGLARDQSPATVTNVAFAIVHITVLMSGTRFALMRPKPSTRAPLHPAEAS
jgi:cellulose synthase (UDP-forming)